MHSKGGFLFAIVGPLERTVILGVKLEAAAEFVVKEEEEGDGGEEGDEVYGIRLLSFLGEIEILVPLHIGR